MWLLTFAAALAGTQIFVALGWLDVSHACQLAQQGSISGALVGPHVRLDFDLGIVSGVFLGSFAAAAGAGELKLEGFSDWLGMCRHLVGAVLMGFGAMLAGGCAVGAGVTGASVFALTAWIVLIGMWLGAGLTDLIVDRGFSRKVALTVDHRGKVNR